MTDKYSCASYNIKVKDFNTKDNNGCEEISKTESIGKNKILDCRCKFPNNNN